jgi:hypothetical protein
VILFDLDPSREHGQVILYGGPGYRARTSTTPRSRRFDEDMLPLLQQGDLDGALNAALRRSTQTRRRSTPRASSSPARSTPPSG